MTWFRFVVLSMVMIVVCLSSARGDASPYVYGIWQPVAGGEWVKIDPAKPVGGSIRLRVVFPAESRPGGSPRVYGVTIAEEKTPVHDLRVRELHTGFTPSEPSVEWGDGESEVLQSDMIPCSAYHNAVHVIRVVTSPEERGPSDRMTGLAEMKLQFNSLVVEDRGSNPILSAQMSEVQRPVMLGCKLTHAQSGRCNIKYEIFSLADNTRPLVTQEFKDVPFPGRHSWTWDWRWQTPRQVECSLFTYRISVQNADDPGDCDVDRSPYLSVGVYINGMGVPETDSKYSGYSGPEEDARFYEGFFIYETAYSLTDVLGKSAKSGEWWYYDGLNFRALSRSIDKFKCTLHGNMADGRLASTAGMMHTLYTPIPTKLMDFAGTYHWFPHLVDDHADMYKDHKPKPALDGW